MKFDGSEIGQGFVRHTNKSWKNYTLKRCSITV